MGMTTGSVGVRRSATRQTPYVLELPPNDYVVGAAVNYDTPTRDLLGCSEIRAAVVNNTAGNLDLMAAWTPTDTFVAVLSGPTVLDAVSGLQIASVNVPVTFRYWFVRFRHVLTLGADFRLGVWGIAHG